jgi:hypothetical protein
MIKHTYILIRPDAVVARKVDLIINELKKINFEPIYSRTLKICSNVLLRKL